MEAVFLKLLNVSIMAGWLVLAVILLRFLFWKAPKWMRGVLWAMVAVRLVCPVSPESIFSLIPSTQTIPQEILTTDTPAINSGVKFLNHAVNPVIAESFAPDPAASANPMQIMVFAASRVWIAGAAVMLLYMFVSFISVKRKVREAVCENGNVWICDHIATSFILGIFRPRIYLPSDMTEADRAYVLAHERAHLRRRDYLWKPLAFLLLGIYWFQPLLWIAYVLLCRDIELACDERVVRELGTESKKPYSDTLINYSVSRKTIAACPLAFGEVGVKMRVKNVLHYKKPAFWLVLAAACACIVTALCLLTNPAEKGGEKPVKAGDNINGMQYRVSSVVYDDLSYSYYAELKYSAMNPDDAGQYCISEDWVLMDNQGEPWSSAWNEIGKLTETSLTEENFDHLFSWESEDNSGWTEGESSRKLRKENKKVWSTVKENVRYYVMLQENGMLYLTYGYEYMPEESRTSHIRWVFKLQPTESMEAAGSDGEQNGEKE